jgi:hypothetical protein
MTSRESLRGRASVREVRGSCRARFFGAERDAICLFPRRLTQALFEALVFALRAIWEHRATQTAALCREQTVRAARANAGIADLTGRRARASFDVAVITGPRRGEGRRPLVVQARHGSQERDDRSQPKDSSDHGASAPSRLLESQHFFTNLRATRIARDSEKQPRIGRTFEKTD